MAGYSGTPLVKKLGIKRGAKWITIDAPKEYRSWLAELPDEARISNRVTKSIHSLHLFATKRSVLTKHLKTLRKQLAQDGFIWVSWPKKAAKMETDITEDVIREVALPLGFVDIKVCAVNEIWSGLKLVIRKSERSSK